MSVWAILRALGLIEYVLFSGLLTSVHADVDNSNPQYQVIEDTQVYRLANEDSEQIASIPSGTIINVFASHGEWVEIWSRYGRPPGFIKKASVASVRPKETSSSLA